MRNRSLVAALLSSAIAACNGTGDGRGSASATGEALGSGDDGAGVVYVLSNEPGGNAVLAFARASDGTLSSAGSFPTGGTGTGAGLGSQGAITVTRDGRWLLAVNAGSDDVSIFSVSRDGLELVDRAPSGGDMPISVTVSDGVAFVLNAGTPNNVSGLRIGGRGALEPIPGSTRPLSADDAGPAQVAFDRKGEVLAVTEKTTSRISLYRVADGGAIDGPHVVASSGQTPFGFAFTGGDLLVVSEAAASTVSSYRVNDDGLEAVTASAPDFQAAACWIAIPDSGRYAYAANTGAGTISGYSIREDGTLALLEANGVTAAAGGGAADLAFSRGSRFLYVRNGRDGTISGYRLQADGGLEPVELERGLPAGAAGLVAQ